MFDNKSKITFREIKYRVNTSSSFLMDKIGYSLNYQLIDPMYTLAFLKGLTNISKLTDKTIDIIKDFANKCRDLENELNINKTLEKYSANSSEK